MYYKVESYIASEQAGKVLYENDLTPIYVSDNPVLNAQHVVFEAAKGYRYGLPYHAALAGVTTAPAELLGMGERIGKIKSGFDADVVVWDSDPLSVGATPVQVWIDGTAQFPDAVELAKPFSNPMQPDMALAADIVDVPIVQADVVFTGVSQIMIPGSEQVFDSNDRPANVVVRGGKIVCTGVCEVEMSSAAASKSAVVSLNNGYLSPSFTAFGSEIGLSELSSEGPTQNGADSSESFSRAVDGLQFETKQLKASYAHGVTRAITAPVRQGGGHLGVSAGFSTGASHALEQGAVWADEVGLHYTLSLAAKRGKTPSISSAIGALRDGLHNAITSKVVIGDSYSEAAFLKEVVKGEIPLIITVHSADTIAALLRVKSEVEAVIKSTDGLLNSKSGKITIVILGGAESHLVAKEIAAADVSVVLAPLLSYCNSWDERRALTGAPVTNGTAIDALLDAGVLTAIGTTESESWEVRNLPLMAGIAYKNSGGKLSETDALSLVGRNFDKILGTKTSSEDDFVVFEGNPLEINSRVKAVGSMGKVSMY